MSNSDFIIENEYIENSNSNIYQYRNCTENKYWKDRYITRNKQNEILEVTLSQNVFHVYNTKKSIKYTFDFDQEMESISEAIYFNDHIYIYNWSHNRY